MWGGRLGQVRDIEDRQNSPSMEWLLLNFHLSHMALTLSVYHIDKWTIGNPPNVFLGRCSSLVGFGPCPAFGARTGPEVVRRSRFEGTSSHVMGKMRQSAA